MLLYTDSFGEDRSSSRSSIGLCLLFWKCTAQVHIISSSIEWENCRPPAIYILFLPRAKMQLFIDSAEYLFATTHGQIVLALLVLFLASLIITTYNLFFHPLAKFPGPKVAAATGLYEFWYDVVRQGQYVYKIEQMHCDYGTLCTFAQGRRLIYLGPIVRINPDELSIRDAEYWDKLYAPGKRMNIPTRFAKIFPLKGSMLFTPSHEIHKARRKAVEPFFSRQNIARIEPMIVEQATILDERLRQISGSGKVVTLEHAIFAFASDVVGRICCETSTIPHLLQEKDFAPQW